MDPFFSQGDVLQLQRLQANLSSIQQAVEDGQIDSQAGEALRQRTAQQMVPLQQRQQQAQQTAQQNYFKEMTTQNQFEQVMKANNRKFQAATFQDGIAHAYDHHAHAELMAQLKAQNPMMPANQLSAVASSELSKRGGAKAFVQTGEDSWEPVGFPHEPTQEDAADGRRLSENQMMARDVAGALGELANPYGGVGGAASAMSAMPTPPPLPPTEVFRRERGSGPSTIRLSDLPGPYNPIREQVEQQEAQREGGLPGPYDPSRPVPAPAPATAPALTPAPPAAQAAQTPPPPPLVARRPEDFQRWLAQAGPGPWQDPRNQGVYRDWWLRGGDLAQRQQADREPPQSGVAYVRENMGGQERRTAIPTGPNITSAMMDQAAQENKAARSDISRMTRSQLEHRSAQLTVLEQEQKLEHDRQERDAAAEERVRHAATQEARDLHHVPRVVEENLLSPDRATREAAEREYARITGLRTSHIGTRLDEHRTGRAQRNGQLQARPYDRTGTIPPEHAPFESEMHDMGRLIDQNIEDTNEPGVPGRQEARRMLNEMGALYSRFGGEEQMRADPRALLRFRQLRQQLRNMNRWATYQPPRPTAAPAAPPRPDRGPGSDRGSISIPSLLRRAGVLPDD